MGRFSAWLALAGLAITAVAIIWSFMEPGTNPSPLNRNPFPPTLLSIGAGCLLIAGVIWTHTRGERKTKAAILGALSLPAGAFLGIIYARGESDMGRWFADMWISAALLAALSVGWIIWFHRRYAAEPFTPPDRGGFGAA